MRRLYLKLSLGGTRSSLEGRTLNRWRVLDAGDLSSPESGEAMAAENF